MTKKKGLCDWLLAYALFPTGAFNAFDKDGDGIIKLNVLEVRNSSTSSDCRTPDGVSEVDWTPRAPHTQDGTLKESQVKVVIPGACVPQEPWPPKLHCAEKHFPRKDLGKRSSRLLISFPRDNGRLFACFCTDLGLLFQWLQLTMYA